MTTIREFKKFIDPILKSDKTLVYSRGTIFLTPVRHMLRGIAFHPTSWRTGMKVTVEIQPACFVSGAAPLGAVWPNGYWPKHNYWESEQEGFLEHMTQAILVECLPELRPLHDIESCMEKFRSRYDNSTNAFENIRMFYHFMLGRFDLVQEALRRKASREQRGMLARLMPGLGEKLIEMGDALPLEEKRAIIRWLHLREEVAIGYFKLRRYWEPTPFPAEELGLV